MVKLVINFGPLKSNLYACIMKDIKYSNYYAYVYYYTIIGIFFLFYYVLERNINTFSKYKLIFRKSKYEKFQMSLNIKFFFFPLG